MLAKTELDEAHDTLRKAADWIEKYGWWNGKGKQHYPAGCAVQTIVWIASETDPNNINTGTYSKTRNQAADGARKLLAEHLSLSNDFSIQKWNDASSAKLVIETLRNAAYGIK